MDDERHLWMTSDVVEPHRAASPMAHQRVLSALTRLGGCATWSDLVHECSPHLLRRARMAGAVHRTRRGRYVLPTAAAHRREAHRLTGVLSHLSAAVAHGWAVKTQPDRPWKSRSLANVI